MMAYETTTNQAFHTTRYDLASLQRSVGLTPEETPGRHHRTRLRMRLHTAHPRASQRRNFRMGETNSSGS